MAGSFLYIWLSGFDLFNIWYLFLAVLGLSILYGHSKAKTASWLIPLALVVHTFISLIASVLHEFTRDLGI
jgi:hypothetical protein